MSFEKVTHALCASAVANRRSRKRHGIFAKHFTTQNSHRQFHAGEYFNQLSATFTAGDKIRALTRVGRLTSLKRTPRVSANGEGKEGGASDRTFRSQWFSSIDGSPNENRPIWRCPRDDKSSERVSSDAHPHSLRHAPLPHYCRRAFFPKDKKKLLVARRFN